MSTLFAWLEGKKTYIVAFIAAALGLATAIWPDFTLPEWAYFILSALGLGAVRAALPSKQPPSE